VGAVVAAFEADNTLRHFVVQADGLQPVSPVLAAIMRNTNSYGLQQPPRLAADEVSRLPWPPGSTPRPTRPASDPGGRRAGTGPPARTGPSRPTPLRAG
jgi:hypothetical protein